ncbi:hypothetical protein EYF80_058579 [Liparis tanakae]|uniref:Uncharacterized protein n=1 Tax=Liparis tanakae TaxID=230148 RepID=A0A4Z2ER50_9TELE|nr:hypothetical protein EYF80_058579 [Liparis tanakae]
MGPRAGRVYRPRPRAVTFCCVNTAESPCDAALWRVNAAPPYREPSRTGRPSAGRRVNTKKPAWRQKEALLARTAAEPHLRVAFRDRAVSDAVMAG